MKDFLDIYHLVGPAINVKEIMRQRRLVKELDARMKTLYGNASRDWTARQQRNAASEIRLELTYLCLYPSGRLIANKLWDKYCPDTPKTLGMLLSKGYLHTNTILPGEKNKDMARTNKRNIMFMHPTYRNIVK